MSIHMRRIGSALLATTLAIGPAMASTNRIAIIAQGPHPYFLAWEKATKDAQHDFKIAAVDFKVATEWQLKLQSELIESLISQGYNGFGLSPVDAVGINSTLDEAKAAGIPSISLGSCAAEPTPALFCLSTDVSSSTYDATKRLIAAMGGRGKIVHLAGMLVDSNTKPRIEAVERAIAETNGQVTLLQTIADTDNEEKADQKINALLGAERNTIDGIIATGYVSSAVAAKVLRDLGDKRIKLVGTADDKAVIDGIRDGFVTGTIGLNAYAEAYVGAYALDQLAGGRCTVKPNAPFLTMPTSNRFIDSGPVFVTAANVDTYKDEMATRAKTIQASFDADYLNCR